MNHIKHESPLLLDLPMKWYFFGPPFLDPCAEFVWCHCHINLCPKFDLKKVIFRTIRMGQFAYAHYLHRISSNKLCTKSLLGDYFWKKIDCIISILHICIRTEILTFEYECISIFLKKNLNINTDLQQPYISIMTSMGLSLAIISEVLHFLKSVSE